MANADTKAENQTLLCLDTNREQPCRRSLLLVDDVGWSFGGGYSLARPLLASKMQLEHWRRSAVWRDRSRCIAAVHPSWGATLLPTAISEAGRRFLLERYGLLSRQQKEDLFRAARVELQQIRALSADEWGTPSAWADVLDLKIAEVAANPCPS